MTSTVVRRLVSSALRVLVGASLLMTAGLVAPCAVEGSGRNPGTLFSTALARERALREPGGHPSLNDLRAAIAGYETIVRRFPQSPFGERALWQGAGLAVEAYDLYRERLDYDTGVRLLRLLEFNHPTGSLAGRVADRLEELDALTRVAWLSDIRREIRPETVRVTITLDRRVRFSSEVIDNPSRIFFDLAHTESAPRLRNATLSFTEDDAGVQEIRLGRHPSRVTRVVLDTEQTNGCDSFTLDDPFRLVVECNRFSEPKPRVISLAPEPYLGPLMAIGLTVEPVPLFPRAPKLEVEERLVTRRLDPIASPPRPSPVDSDGVLSVARQLGLGVSRIVIDAGHGGDDPGAKTGSLSEADLVLDIALRLEQRLEASAHGLDVVLTRRADDYIPLQRRTTLANDVGADLFLSIHANASEDPSVRGIETYFLNFPADTAAQAVAARENFGGLATMNELYGLLQAIVTNSRLDESRDFAQTIQTSLVETLGPVSSGLPDLGVKQAPFVVLIGARMPSVLAEISFLTNDRDAMLLTTDVYRDLVADALFEGILEYQRSLENRTAAVLTDDGGV